MRSFLVSALAAASLAIAPTASIAANPPVDQAAPEAARAGAEVEDANAIRGGFILPLLGLIAIVAVLLLVLGDDNNEEGVSP